MADTSCAHYEPNGWTQWPDYPWLSYQFRRVLGETQEGGGAISECFMAASKIDPSNVETWYKEWNTIGAANEDRGNIAAKNGNFETAKNCWLRATNYYRSAEFWLSPDDPRRLETFTRCENSFTKASKYFFWQTERVEIPYEAGKVLYAYYIKAKDGSQKTPVLISFGGLDSFKEELFFMVARGALKRGISCLLVDGPGQGATLRKEKIPTRYDWEFPVGKCIEYLSKRDDVDMDHLALSGSSLGGYYAARAGSMDNRIKATISHGAVWSIYDLWKDRDEDYGLAMHMKWVFNKKSVKEVIEEGKKFTLEGVLKNMKGKYLILQGGNDFISVTQAQKVFDYAKENGIDVTLKVLNPTETGAEHCQHDNPTIGEEYMMDWLVGALKGKE